MYENPGEAIAPLSPAADAHGSGGAMQTPPVGSGAKPKHF